MAKRESLRFSYKKFQDVTEKLRSTNKFNEDMFWFNVVSPYLMSLGYNLYDLEGADYDADNKVIYFDVFNLSGKDKVVISCGLFDLNIDEVGDETSLTYQVVNNKKAVHYLYFNMEELSATLYLILNDNIYQITKSDPEKDKAEDKYRAISLRIARENIRKGFTDNGKSYFTTMVLMGLLSRKTYVGNNFVEETLVEMFKNPSDELIKLLSDELRVNYINKATSEEQVFSKLEPIKETFIDVVKSALRREDYSGTGYDIPETSSGYDDIEIEEARGKSEEPKRGETSSYNKEQEEVKEPETKPKKEVNNIEDRDLGDLGEDINIIGSSGGYTFDTDADDDISNEDEEPAYGVFGTDDDDDFGSLNFLGDDDEDDESEEPDPTDLSSILGG